MTPRKPHFSFWQIINMNFGFFGIQYSFGLQQSNMSPIYKFLGADEANLPYLWLAGPVTGLIAQPIVGALSDRTLSKWGRRTPYFLVGAILCSVCLCLMPFSRTLWMAAGLLWILDAANNITMEPYRAFVSDRLDVPQRPLGFLTQSAFTGFGQTLSYLTPSLLVFFGMNKDAVTSRNIPYITVAAFLIGGIVSIVSILWTLKTTREAPLDPAEVEEIRRRPRGLKPIFVEIGQAIAEMPPTMRQLAGMKLFQWYAMFCYWQYIVLSLSTTLYGTTNEHTSAFREAGLINGQIGSFYNLIAFLGAFAMTPFTARFGPRNVHCFSLVLAAAGMIAIPLIHTKALLFVPMIGVGIGWASMMGNPYIMLAGAVPPRRVGVYMGIFNLFIVVPMIIQIFTLPLYYRTWLGGNPENVIRLAGALLLCGAVAVLFVRPVERGSEATARATAE